MKYSGIIYKYTSPSGKSYIGLTIDEKSRRSSFLNKNGVYSGQKIERARAKYGPENFEYEVIFKVESFIEDEVKQLLNEKEIQYILLFDSKVNGYNSDEGGNSMTFDRTEEYRSKLSKATTEYYKTHKSHTARPILQFNLKGEFILEHESAAKAAEALNLTPATITSVCKGNRNNHGEFIWRYKSDFEDIPDKIKVNLKSSNLPLKQYSIKGEYIREWPTMQDAATELGYSLGNFSTYCNGRNDHEYKGFKYYRGDISLYD